MAERKFLSKIEFANALGISLPTVNRHLKKGTLHAVKFGGRVLVPLSELERLENLATVAEVR